MNSYLLLTPLYKPFSRHRFYALQIRKVTSINNVRAFHNKMQ
ncbi:hypothetical protein ALT721_2570020 [Alteromonas alvinellae]